MKYKSKYIIVCVVVGLLVFFFSNRLVYITDDFHFKFVFQYFDPLGNEKRVTGISDIVESMKNYYQISGGRVLAHSLVYLFLLIDKNVFNIINAVVFITLGVLINLLSGSEKVDQNQKGIWIWGCE